jgi:hypothetical protein
MVAVKQLFKDRKDEVEIYFSFLHSLSQTRDKEELFKILKSNLILMLYNMVEACMRSSIEYIYIDMELKQVSFDSLTDKLKNRIINDLKYINKTDKNTVQKINSIATGIAKLSFKKDKMFSGNIDAKKIKNLSKNYGFTCNTNAKESKDGECLRTIKDKRNDLAHGVESFSEVGKEYTIQDLERMKNECIAYLSGILDNIEEYLNNQRYLSAPPCEDTQIIPAQLS